MYGEKNTFEDARTTVAKFLDDFYDDGEDNYNQAFLNLERRLQDYFGYERRGSTDIDDAGAVQQGRKSLYAVYNDGHAWGKYRLREDAEAVVRSYAGEHDVWIEEEEVEDEQRGSESVSAESMC